MKLHFVQHVPFEGPAAVADWVESRGHESETTRLFSSVNFPDPSEIDFLVVLGGPMGVSDTDEFSWLASEKDFLRRAMGAGVPVLGICLGAQLLAEALGARVYKNSEREIGWFPIERVSESTLIPTCATAFHWHGDTFDLPAGSLHLASSSACKNQAFLAEGKFMGLQFHLEATEESAEKLILNCARDLLPPGNYVQTAEEIRESSAEHAERANGTMFGLLDAFSGVA